VRKSKRVVRESSVCECKGGAVGWASVESLEADRQADRRMERRMERCNPSMGDPMGGGVCMEMSESRVERATTAATAQTARPNGRQTDSHARTHTLTNTHPHALHARPFLPPLLPFPSAPLASVWFALSLLFSPSLLSFPARLQRRLSGVVCVPCALPALALAHALAPLLNSRLSLFSPNPHSRTGHLSCWPSMHRTGGLSALYFILIMSVVWSVEHFLL